MGLARNLRLLFGLVCPAWVPLAVHYPLAFDLPFLPRPLEDWGRNTSSMAKISHYDSDGDDDATLNGLSDSDTEEPGASAGVSEPPAPPSSQPPPNPQESAGLTAAKNVGIGLACVVGIPVGAALLTVGGVLYGAGKILEGVGRGLAVGPEVVANAMNPEQAKQQPAEAPKPEEKQNSPPQPQPKHKAKRKRRPRKPKPKSDD